MTVGEMLHILRNPWGKSEDEKRQAMLMAAEIVEETLRLLSKLESKPKKD